MNVTIKKISKTEEAIKFAYETIKNSTKNLPKSSKIIIKPNIAAPMLPCTGVTTHHEIVIGVLDALSDFTNVKIVESDTTSSDF